MDKELEFEKGDYSKDTLSFEPSGEDVCAMICNNNTDVVAVYIMRPSDVRDTIDFLNEHLKNVRR